MPYLSVQWPRFGEVYEAVRMDTIQSGTLRLKLPGGWSVATHWSNKERKL